MDIFATMTEDETSDANITPAEHKALVDRVEQQVRDALARRLTFLLTGRTGMGKSSTINTLLGEPVAAVNAYAPETVLVKPYEGRIEGIACTIYDTPGLCDALPEEGNDEKYLEQIQRNVKEVDCVWFVTRLDETRMSSDEMRGIKLLSQALGPDVWDHALIIFTFANSVRREKFGEAVENRTRLIRQEIAKYTRKEVAEAIPSVPVENTDEYTLDGRQWLGRLYLQILKRIEKHKARPFMLMMHARTVVEDDDAPRTEPAATYSASTRGAKIRVKRSEFQQALADTWEGAKRLYTAGAVAVTSAIKSGWEKFKSWF